MVDPDYPMIPISRQCDLLRFARSSFYYDSQRDDTHNLMLMNRIDEQFTKSAVLRRAEDDGLAAGCRISGQS